MIAITPETKVGELVAANPSAARVFEKSRLDYCCGGKRTIAQACAAKKVDVQQLIRDLDATLNAPAVGERNWNDASSAELTKHIEDTHHGWLRAELPRLSALTRKVAAVHGEAHPEMKEVAEVFEGLATEMYEHMQKEERVLFPLLRKMEETGTSPHKIEMPINCLIHEHDDAGRALERMRTLTRDYTPPLGACNTYRVTLDSLRRLEEDMHQHVHKENNILFPRAMKGG